MHDCDSLIFLLRSMSLVWPTILFILPWEGMLGNGFNLVVLNPSDRKGHDTCVVAIKDKKMEYIPTLIDLVYIMSSFLLHYSVSS